MARSVVCTATQFTSYDVVKRALVHNGWDTNSLGTHLCAGIAAGSASAVIVSPLDMIKARMMQSSINADGKVVKMYKNDFDCFYQTLRHEGARGLWKGLGPAFMRQTPQIVLMWVLYEQYAKLWNAMKP